jgi:hypothetical protein
MTTAPEDRIREIASLPKRTTQPVTQQSVNLNPNMETTAEDRIREIAALPKRTVQSDPNPNMAVLDPKQYPMAEITTNTGEKVMVYTGGPLAGQDDKGNFPIQASGTTAKLADGTDPNILSIMSGLGGLTTPPGGAVGGGAVGSGVVDTEKSDAYKRLFDEFNALGLGALVEDSKDLLMKATSISQMPEALRNTKAYMTRFSANDARIKSGLTALSPAAYLALEDKYQEVMRQYGLPESYYATGTYGKQEGFEKLIANNIASTELEDRLITAQERVIRGAPQITQALKEFYPEITNGDILAYALDPANAIKNIQRKVTTAEIGGAALQQKGLTTSLARAEELQRYGVDKAAATAGYSTIGAGLQRGSELASIYGESPYTQATAESEVFKLAGEQEARNQRQRVTGLEKATFGGKSGLTGGALARDRAGGI